MPDVKSLVRSALAPARRRVSEEMSWQILAAVATAVFATALATCVLLELVHGGSGSSLKAARSASDTVTLADLVRLALYSIAGAAGIIALTLAYRRQVLHERQDQDAAAVTFADRFGRAAEQLGSPAPAIRIAGVYALAALADTYPDNLDSQHRDRRQQVIDTLCGYLRLPQTSSSEMPDPTVKSTASTGDELGSTVPSLDDHVRNTILTVIRNRTSASRPSWSSHTFDFRKVRFHAVDLAGCTLATADFTGATFAGEADFSQFIGCARFDGSSFAGAAVFRRAQFSEGTQFAGAAFGLNADFGGVTFTSDAPFLGARFGGVAHFHGAAFDGEAWFAQVKFEDAAQFWNARFSGPANFNSTTFVDAHFGHATFGSPTIFSNALVEGEARFESVAFDDETEFVQTNLKGNANFADAHFESTALFTRSHFSMSATFGSSTFKSYTDFNQAIFDSSVSFTSVIFGGNTDFEATNFKGRTRFDRATFQYTPQFQGATVTGRLSFDDTSFQEEIPEVAR